ncbi:MAG: N-acetylneuraminate synthase [Candidatus Omnitrophica bacterium CG1_02_49_16]|nr:MAG: N-acetylneuraminate synthase [Candidatus Omnitrophica bacterium CG1_02_49_16]
MSPAYIIAEAGVNHNGSLAMAKKLVDAAARAGVDAVKFQAFNADRLVTKNAPKASYQIKADRQSRTQWEMIRRLELNEASHRVLFSQCRRRKIGFISTPFDKGCLSFLIRVGVNIIKISSSEITNGPFLVQAARTNLPIILSTGMSTLKEVEESMGALAFGYLRKKGNPTRRILTNLFRNDLSREVLKNKVILLHCTTEYPAPFIDVNLMAMDTLARHFGVKVGLSDHSEGIAVAIAAVARGAAVVEKHFTLDRNLPGPDHRASLEPKELAVLVRSIREVEQAIGSGKKTPARSEIKNRAIVRKSIVAAAFIKRGDRFSEKNLAAKRPGSGLSPMHYWDLLGKASIKDYQIDERVTQ